MVGSPKVCRVACSGRPGDLATVVTSAVRAQHVRRLGPPAGAIGTLSQRGGGGFPLGPPRAGVRPRHPALGDGHVTRSPLRFRATAASVLLSGQPGADPLSHAGDPYRVPPAFRRIPGTDPGSPRGTAAPAAAPATRRLEPPARDRPGHRRPG